MMLFCGVFFFNDTATTEIYTLSLHDALPIYDDYDLIRAHRLGLQGRDRSHQIRPAFFGIGTDDDRDRWCARRHYLGDRKSTRLNSSHANISYAVFCLKKKNYTNYIDIHLLLL